MLELVRSRQDEICHAALADMGRSEVETHISEIVVIKEELKLFIRNLRRWARPQRVSTPIQLFPAKSYLMREPFGKVLVIAPWNFPFHLSLVPAIGALAAGNTVVIKPSPHAPACAALLAKLINEELRSERIWVLPADEASVQDTVRNGVQFIFFTGSPAHGREVNKLAAEYMIPAVMELGGQNPLIYHGDADEALVKRIVWGKFLNAGQTCLSPNHVFVHESKREAFLRSFRNATDEMYGADALTSEKYASIINERQYRRLEELLERHSGRIISGGMKDGARQRIAPALAEVPLQEAKTSELVQNEIFGPICPVIFYKDVNDVLDIVKQHSPLVVYLFSRDKNLRKRLSSTTTSGAVCVNDCLVHGANPNFPFGGTHGSGIGKYHGKYSFLIFSNTKGVLVRSRLDLMPRFFKKASRILFILKRM